ncbi:peptide chain release factor H [Micromonospora sp. 15K316]|uniref:peptide chain release factor H n=1 Tax=Micromonospora sp. 15K316 TaxID=2530376 RepID=UPI001048110C|nr:peptide chain release factor H [Micromonospora sp. 15K316]TDC40552.1 peptide chain release factor H [Micromonospora sp. 15K316]
MTVHLFLSAGRGPQECAWALTRLLRRLEADATRRGLTTRRIQTVPGERPDTHRSALLRIDGGDAEEFTAGWTGTLCWQAPSPYRASTGRKNWYVVARPCRLDGPTTSFSADDVDVVACRTGGRGGQHRNKASTAVRATHRPTGIVVVVDTERQFSLNRRIALRRLRQRVEDGDEAARRDVVTDRWRIHDELVRGDPTRVERPEPAGRDPAPRRSRPVRGRSPR